MAAYDTLRAAIDNYIKANGNKEITGTVLNDILNAMVSALGADTRFAGVAVPSTNPGNPEGNVVYFASQAGTYSNFGGIVLPLGIHILVWNGTTWTSQTWFSVDNTPTQNSQNLATSGGILQAIVDAVGVERLRAIGAEVTSCSFDDTTKKISFFNSADDTLFQLDATAFVIDGMVSDVKIEDGNLVIQFNTDAGKQDIEIPLTDIFNPANYYTKTAIDELLALYYTKTETDALLTAINNKLADGCLYRGMAEPTTNPPTPTTKVFYIATRAGTYTNFGNIAVTEGITILKYDGSNWSKEQISYSDGVFDISAYNGTSYADLSAALGTNGANIPQNLRKGGMSIKFVQSSDNKYVQYRLMANQWSTTPSDWQGVDGEPTAGSKNLVESGGVATAIQNNPNVGYFVCDTAAGTAAKTVSSANYILPTTGGCIKIKMTNANTAASGVTLKIGSATAKPLYYAGLAVSASNTWKAGETIEVYYDGTNYQANNVAGGGSGVYDISAEHSNTAYADLAAALGTNGANVPTSIRKSGMSVKFLRNIFATYYVLRTEGVEEVPSGGILLESTPSVYNGTYTASELSAFSASAPLPESTSAAAVVYYVVVTVDETTTYTTWSITMVSADVQEYEQYRYTLPYENTTAGNNNFKNTANWQKESVFENDSDSVDFSIKDEKGNVIFQIANGHIKTKFFDSSLLNNRTHWYGKKWFAYGTSMTNTSNEGKYPKYIDRLSGMIRTNRGFSGGGITTSSNQAIYNAICSMDDNKDIADLITLEIGANDDNAPLGDFTSYADNSTLIGALILCIRYLQEHTNAQIVVFPSPHQRKIVWPRVVICDGTQTFGSDNHTMLERDDAIRKVCMMYDVPFIAPCSNLGYARMNASNLFNTDQIHHTELGGLNYALSIWSHLKNIQPFIVYNS